MVRGIGTYARSSPEPYKLLDGNYSTIGGKISCSELLYRLFWIIKDDKK